MPFKSQSQVLIILFVAIMAASFMMAEKVQAQPEIYLALSDTTISGGAQNAWVSVLFANYQDTLQAFTIWIICDRPNYVDFRTGAIDTTYRYITEYCADWDQGTCLEWRDTVIIDTVITSGAIDTVGTLISGWEYVTARSYLPGRTEIKVTAMADALGMPYTPGLLPQTNPGILFRLRLNAASELFGDDTLDNTVEIKIDPKVSETSFSDPHGELFGTITTYNICDSTYVNDTLVCDTFFYYGICKTWDGSNCTERIWTFNDDSAIYADTVIVDTMPSTVLNESTVFYDDGTVTLNFINCICGDSDNSGSFNLGDAVFLINFIFKDGLEPEYPACSDVNNDGRLNLGDAIYGINAIFKGGAMPDCGF